MVPGVGDVDVGPSVDGHVLREEQEEVGERRMRRNTPFNYHFTWSKKQELQELPKYQDCARRSDGKQPTRAGKCRT